VARRCFITGATGFIGGHVARALKARGDDVVCLARSVERAQGLTDLGCSVVLGDLSSEEGLARGVRDADVVVHAAANVSLGLVDPEQMWNDNVVGTERLIHLATEAGVERIVVVSSVDHFGGAGGREIDETFERSPEFVTVYEYTKHEATKVAMKYHEEAGAPVSIAYPGRTLGIADPNFGPLLELYAARKLPVLLAPDAWATYGAVEDVAEGIVLIADRGKPGEGYILAESPFTLRGLFRECERITGIPAPRWSIPRGLALRAAKVVQWLFVNTDWIEPVKGRPPLSVEVVRAAFALSAKHSNAKARRELGWEPTPVPQVLERILPWYREQAREKGLLRA